MTIKYILYARKSSESDDRQAASIDDQLSEMKRIADSNNLSISEIISESRSAKAPGRSEFNRMLEILHSGKAQGILCWKLNRLSRNPVDGGQISWMLQNKIIQHIQTYGREYKPSDNVLMMQVELGMATQYVKDLSIDVKRGQRRKAERGWMPHQNLLPGYKHNRDRGVSTQDEIIVDEPNYSIVKKLWKLMLSGNYSVTAIKREGDQIGLVNTKGRLLSLNTYHRMFTREFYYGPFYWPDETGNSVRHIGKHKKMISKSQFDMVQDILTNKSVPTRKQIYNFPYKGLLHCGNCLGNITAEHKRLIVCDGCKLKFSAMKLLKCPRCQKQISEMTDHREYSNTYYHCINRKGECDKKSVTLDEIDKIVSKELAKIKINKDAHVWITDAIHSTAIDNTDDKTQIKSLKERISKLEKRLLSLLEMRLDNELSPEDFQALRDKLEAEKGMLAERLKHIITQNAEWKKLARSYCDFATKDFNQYSKLPEEKKHTVFSKLCSNPSIRAKKLYIPTNNIVKRVNECAVAYTTLEESFEPKKDLIEYRQKGPTYMENSVMRAQWKNLRTACLEELDRKLNEKLK